MEEEGVVSQLSGSSSEHQLPVLMPSRIGSEFVRQYYLLLRKAPEYLHRFYTNDSICTHGDLDMALGQNRIKSLFRLENYTECKTTVLHVDTHGTMFGGVVVVVTGEQSNAGFPKRPFVQTFVLVPKGPSRYYVSNDIFRYTDAVVDRPKVRDVQSQTSMHHIGDGDQECFYIQQDAQEHKAEREIRDLRNKTELYSDVKTETSSACSSVSEFCGIPMPRWANISHQYTEMKIKNFPKQCNEHNDGKSDSTLSCRSMIAQTLTPALGIEDEASKSNYEISSFHSEEVKRVSTGVRPVRGLKRHEVGLLGTHPHPQKVNNNHHPNQSVPHDHQQVDDAQSTTMESEEKMPTYAKLVMSALTRANMKNNSNPDSTMTSSSTSLHKLHTNDNMKSHETPKKLQTLKADCQDHSFPVPGPYQGSVSMQRSNNQNVRRNDRRRTSSAQKYDDNQQLFLGQIPHNATEKELINIFSCFGNVLELRILPNLGGKLQPGAKHPLKYGFLTFEHVASVKACLESRPVFFPKDSPFGQKLNVRAKKPCPRNDTSSSCQPLDNLSTSRNRGSVSSACDRR